MAASQKKSFAALVLLLAATAVHADYRDDIGLTRLRNALGAAMPTGAGVSVTQVEAPERYIDSTYPVYAPNPSNGQFTGKTITFPDGNPSGTFSGHATGVGNLFYGTNSSSAPGITAIKAYEVNSWLTDIGTASVSTSMVARVANHNWIGSAYDTSTGDAGNSTALRLVDRLVYWQQYIQAVAMNNDIGDNEPLLGSAFNVIAVGKADGNSSRGSVGLSGDPVYVAGRTRPDLVAPANFTSATTPMVSAAAALLVQTGHQGGLTLSHGSTEVSGVGTIYNAERSETIRAALMAGADRATANTSVAANITDYGAAGHRTSNGLDDRYGAGQLDVYNSYRILAAGEQESGSTIGAAGFDFEASFGGSGGSARLATYDFTAATDEMLTASLVWNLGVDNNAGLATTFYHMGLSLIDLGTGDTVASSNSLLDNTQNLWMDLFGGHTYQLRVSALDATNFSWGYALAWNTSPVPVPAAVWLFASAMAGLFGVSARRR